MTQFFDPTPDAIAKLEQLADKIPEIQQVLVENHDKLKKNDRGAHQQQIAGGKVILTVANELPSELDGLGLFEPGAARVGIGRISTGLGCPHVETDLDFLGIMLAFRTPEGRRVDFLGINDPTSPTDTVEEFVALLQATADAAGTQIPLGSSGELNLGDFLASQAGLVKSLRKRLGRWQGYGVAAHVAGQALRTGRSSTAYQQYWTGVVRATDTLGKFAFVPTEEVNKHRRLRPGEKYLTNDWRQRQSDGDLRFRLYWMPFQNEKDTPLEELTEEWDENHMFQVGEVVFPQTDPGRRRRSSRPCSQPRWEPILGIGFGTSRVATRLSARQRNSLPAANWFTRRVKWGATPCRKRLTVPTSQVAGRSIKSLPRN